MHTEVVACPTEYRLVYVPLQQQKQQSLSRDETVALALYLSKVLTICFTLSLVRSV